MKESLKRVYRSAYRAAGLAFDEADIDRIGGKPLFDFLATLLSPADLEKARALFEGTVSEPDGLASDAVMQRRRMAYDAGHISYEQMRAPLPAPPMTQAQRNSFDALFPDNGRLRT